VSSAVVNNPATGSERQRSYEPNTQNKKPPYELPVRAVRVWLVVGVPKQVSRLPNSPAGEDATM
jgi:hypothetical protein